MQLQQNNHKHNPFADLVDFKSFLLNDSKSYESEKYGELNTLISSLKAEKLNKPVIYVGAGTCGLGAGAEKTIKAVNEFLDSNKIEAEVVRVGCIGLCAMEPIMDIQLPDMARISFAKVDEKQAKNILESIMIEKSIPEKAIILGQFEKQNSNNWDSVNDIKEHPFFKPQTRWVLKNCGVINPVDIDQYIAHGGYRALAKVLNHYTPKESCQTVLDSGLRGRGGGGFPAAMKWELALKEAAEQKYMICNADEGDPGAFMDRAVIEGDPFRLLEGLSIAAYSVGATKAYIYIRAEYPLAIKHLIEAIAQAKDYGLLGENILDSGFNLEIVIKKGAGAFVCGEETALMNSIEGKRGMPKPRPPFPTESGLFGKPTVINNVETLANVPEIINNGPDWFKSIGSGNSYGTKVFALSGKITNTGLVEVAMGTTLREIIYEIGGGIPNGKKYKAVQIGGPSGGCIPEQHLDIEVTYESLKTVGAMMGSGGLVVMDEDTCMVDVAIYFMDFIQKESCGKCIPCREGTKRMLEVLRQIGSKTRNGNGHGDPEELKRFKNVMGLKHLAEVIQNTSLCGLGKSAPNPVLGTLRWFKDEYEAHIFDRKCPSKVCKDLLTFSIDNEKCTGCTVCAKQCPTGAILGQLKNPHYIVMDKCISCGTCVDVCKFEAVNVE